MLVLSEPDWLRRRAAHECRVRAWTDPHQRRAGRGEKHPVLDFMFSYYSYRPARLRRWHPGPDVALAGAAALAYLDRPEYVSTPDGVVLAPVSGCRLGTVRFARDLLVATAERTPRLGCHGLHEWAMVYRQPADAVRHADWPLRLGPAGTDRVVESLPVRCSHFDAFRFFTPPARRYNQLQPSRSRQLELEQPGCLHANMDLFKWAYKLAPHSPAELVADCFELALAVRTLDMRAGPYDLSALGHPPVAIETPAGRAEYRSAQARFAELAVPLRSRLIALCDRLLANGSTVD